MLPTTVSDTADEEMVALIPDLPMVPLSAAVRNADGVRIETHDFQVPEKSKNLGNRFKPGSDWAGNAKGRGKGTKNAITMQRLLMESHLRDRLGINAEDLLQRAVQMAMGGDSKIMGLLLDKLIASPKNIEDGDAKDTNITVTIQNQTLSGSDKPVVATPQTLIRVTSASNNPIDGEFSHVKSIP